MKREEDKRLIIPKDAFGEDASEGLGRLNRDEAAEDLHDLEGRLEKRLTEADRDSGKQLHDPGRKSVRRLPGPLRIWIPAAAAVTVVLIASTVYIGLFRERPSAATARVEESAKDTVLIAMAAPIIKVEAEAEVKDEGVRHVAAVVTDEEAVSGKAVSEEAAMAEVAEADVRVEDEPAARGEPEDRVTGGRIIEILEPGQLTEEVVVQVVPETAKAAQGVAAARTETRAATEKKTDTRADHAPRPAGGMESMNAWVSSNIRYPAENYAGKTQQVIVSFKVNADSTVYGLKAEQTPGDRFTEEAFRLLRGGPRWEPAMRNGQPVVEEVRVRITFRLQ